MNSKFYLLAVTGLLLLSACGSTNDELYQQANEFFSRAEYQKALPIYEQLELKDANNINLNPKLALSYAYTGNWEKCVEYGHKALKNQGDFFEVYDKLARCHEELKQDDQALDVYREGIKKYTDRYPFLERAASLFYRQKKYEESARAYISLVKASPRDMDYNYNAAVSLEQMGKYKLAKQYYQHVLKLQPKHSNAYFGLGSVAEKENQPQVAMDYYRKALNINKNHLSALLNLSQLEEKFHDPHALQDWKDYLKLAKKRKQPEKFIQEAQKHIQILEGGHKG